VSMEICWWRIVLFLAISICCIMVTILPNDAWAQTTTSVSRSSVTTSASSRVTTARSGISREEAVEAGGATARSRTARSGTLKATHFWDCSGAACDSRTLLPFSSRKYVYATQYAPLNPNDFPNGAQYGEKLWMTGAASDSLSAFLGEDEGCCGQDPDGGGGCGKCLLVRNANAINADWSAVVMKKNRCPPFSNNCELGKMNLDLAVPGYDNLRFSTANICGSPNIDFVEDEPLTKAQSSVCGEWYVGASSTVDGCNCSALPRGPLRDGCQLFTEWGWRDRGDPELSFEVVACPREFEAYIGAAFDENGPVPPGDGGGGGGGGGDDGGGGVPPPPQQSPPSVPISSPPPPPPTPPAPSPSNGGGGQISVRVNSYNSGFVLNLDAPGREGTRFNVVLGNIDDVNVINSWNIRDIETIRNEDGARTARIRGEIIYASFGFQAARDGNEGSETILGIFSDDGQCLIASCDGDTDEPISPPPPAPPPPPIASPPPGEGWVWAEAQTSCAETCENRGLTCDIVEQSKLTTNSAMRAAMRSIGEECASFGNPSGVAGAPFTNLNTSSTKCFLLKSAKESSCLVMQASNKRALCYCKAPPQPPTNGEWVLGARGAHCGTTCANLGKTCNVEMQRTLTTESAMQEAMAAVGYECRKFQRSRGGAGAPYTSGILIGNNYSAGRNNQCVMTTTTSSAPCNKTNFSNKQSLCFCS